MKKTIIFLWVFSSLTLAALELGASSLEVSTDCNSKLRKPEDYVVCMEVE